MAPMKAWNPDSIRGVVALRCLKKPEDKVSRLWDPEIPVPRGMGFQPMNHRQDADATMSLAVPPHRWPGTEPSLIRRRFSTPVCYTKI